MCALCPQPGGALARLDPPSAWDVAWESPGTHAHLACADCLEVFVIKDAPGREGKPPLIDMSFVKAARINLRCSLCGQEGACAQCAIAVLSRRSIRCARAPPGSRGNDTRKTVDR